jgi:hypothetical protein
VTFSIQENRAEGLASNEGNVPPGLRTGFVGVLTTKGHLHSRRFCSIKDFVDLL